jgi:DNA-binding CsgD family transcriptional regulator
MDKQEFEAISKALHTIKGLLALQISRSYETLESRAVALASTGMTPKEIAEICGTTPHSISVRLAEAKKSNRTKRK